MIILAGKEWNPDKERLLADGAWGTELMKRGLEERDVPEQLNIDRPETVREVAYDYLKAGSDIILTNSFSANRCQLERHGLADKTREINRKAAEISVGAAGEFADAFESAQAGSGTAEAGGANGGQADPRAQTGSGSVGSSTGAGTASGSGKGPVRFFDRPLVAGSMGPTGKLVVMKEIGTDELLDVFSEQAEGLAAGGVDFLLVETMTDLEEMKIAVRAAAKTGLPVIASVSYNKAPAGYRTIMGNSPQQCIDIAVSEGASVVGANCGTGIENYMDLAEELCSIGKAPVWIKANAGLPKMSGTQVVYQQTADEYAGFVSKLLDSGVSVVGGCCGTTPAFVQAMRAQFDSRLTTG